MVTGDCARCPVGPEACGDCMISVLISENSLVDDLSEESCGYALAPEVRSAIELLVAAGLVSTVDIMAVEAAA